MGEYGYAIVTGLITVSVCGVILCCLIIRQQRERQKWKKIAADNYSRGQDEASELLKSTCDRIEQERQRLEETSEKDLLVDSMLALGSYGRRIDRIDNKLRTISSYKTYTEDMNEKTQRLTQSFAVLDSDISAASSVMNGMRKTVQGACDGIQDLLSQLSNVGVLHQTVSEYITELNKVELTLEYLQEKVASIVEDMKTVTAAYDQSPMKKLQSIEMEITGLSLLVNSIQDNVLALSSASDKLENQLRERQNDGGTADKLDTLMGSVEQLSRETEEIRRCLTELQTRETCSGTAASNS